MAAGEDEERVGHVPEAVLELDVAVAVGRAARAGRPARTRRRPSRRAGRRCAGRAGRRSGTGAGRRTARRRRPACAPRASRAHDRVTCSRSSTGSNAASCSSTCARKRSEGSPEETIVAGRAAGEVDGVLQRDERAEGVPEDGVALEPERAREGVHVAGVLLERPGLRRRRVRPALGALVDEQEPAVVAQRVEPVAEHRVVEPRAAVEHDQRQVAGSALLDVQARVAGVDEHRSTLSARDPWLAHCRMPASPMSDQRSPNLWLPPSPDSDARAPTTSARRGARRSPDPEPVAATRSAATREPWWKRAGGGVAASALLVGEVRGQAQGVLLAAAQAQAADDVGHDARLGRRLRLIWGWKFARRLRGAAVRPRDGPRHPAAPRGRRGQRAGVHPVPRRGRSGPSRSAATRSPRRASASPARSSARSAPPRASRSPALTGNDLF